MIHGGCGREGRRRMAVLTEARCRDMRQVLTGRTDTVVTARATRRDSKMIEKHREPAICAMAGIAFLLSRRMIGRLTDALHVVMTGRATAEYRVVVHFDEREPGRFAMAVRAKICREHVIGWFGRRLNAAAGRMAADAIDGRSLKNPADVARFAVGREMSALEREAGREVIEARYKPRLGEADDGQERQCSSP